MTFNYVEPRKFELSSNGVYEVQIIKVELLQSKTLKDMLRITMNVEGSNGIPFSHFIVESDARDKNNERYFDQQLSRFYDAFNIVHNSNPNYPEHRNSWLGLKAQAFFQLSEVEYTNQNGIKVNAMQWQIYKFQKINKSEIKNEISEKNNNTSGSDFPEDIPF